MQVAEVECEKGIRSSGRPASQPPVKLLKVNGLPLESINHNPARFSPSIKGYLAAVEGSSSSSCTGFIVLFKLPTTTTTTPDLTMLNGSHVGGASELQTIII